MTNEEKQQLADNEDELLDMFLSLKEQGHASTVTETEAGADRRNQLDNPHAWNFVRAKHQGAHFNDYVIWRSKNYNTDSKLRRRSYW